MEPNSARPRLARPATLAAAVVLALASSALVVIAAQPKPSAPAADRVARGKYLVSIMACNDCHTPWKMGPNGPEPDMTRYLSGHPETVKIAAPPAAAPMPWAWTGAASMTAFAGPWGISFAANLTPDQNTGLGIWTEEMFIKALRTGKHFGTARPIMPPMPWPAHATATDEDLKSIFAYLRTLKPIANHVPDYIAPKAAPGR